MPLKVSRDLPRAGSPCFLYGFLFLLCPKAKNNPQYWSPILRAVIHSWYLASSIRPHFLQNGHLIFRYPWATWSLDSLLFCIYIVLWIFPVFKMEYVIKLSRNFYSNRRKPDFLQVIVDAVFPLCYNDNVGAVGLPPCFVYLAESLALHIF